MTPEERFEDIMEFRRRMLSPELADDPLSVRMLRVSCGLEEASPDL